MIEPGSGKGMQNDYMHIDLVGSGSRRSCDWSKRSVNRANISVDWRKMLANKKRPGHEHLQKSRLSTF